MSLTGIINSHLIMAACVARNGTDAQKEKYLPKFAHRRDPRRPARSPSPIAGTDLQAIRTRAVRDGDHYIVNGTKTWITMHPWQLLCASGQDDPEAEPRHKGMSMFIAEKSEGFTVSRSSKSSLQGHRQQPNWIFQDYRISADNLIGGVEGRGMQAALGGLELGRIKHCRARLRPGLRRTSWIRWRYAQIRKTFGKR